MMKYCGHCGVKTADVNYIAKQIEGYAKKHGFAVFKTLGSRENKMTLTTQGNDPHSTQQEGVITLTILDHGEVNRTLKGNTGKLKKYFPRAKMNYQDFIMALKKFEAVNKSKTSQMNDQAVYKKLDDINKVLKEFKDTFSKLNKYVPEEKLKKINKLFNSFLDEYNKVHQSYLEDQTK
jgi:hypothetical protein